MRRLISQGDEVRVIEDEGDASERWRSLGAHIARPDYDMADLVERAAQNVRTLVIGDGVGPDTDNLRMIVEGARLANVERIVLYAPRPAASLVDVIKASRLQYLVLATGGGKRVLGRGGIGAEDLAEAVDAADDIGGVRRLELDLADPQSWVTLGCGDRFGNQAQI